MDYEKLYKEALDRAKKEWSDNLDGAYTNYRERLEIIFPELAESEDERIRKVLYGWVYTMPSSNFEGGFSREDILAWLERQKHTAWSEEDENIISCVEVWLDTLCDYLKDSSSAYIPDVRVIIRKLKSLKRK